MQTKKQLSRAFQGQQLNGSGYFIATSDNITDNISMECIDIQDNDGQEDGSFQVSDRLQPAPVEIKPFAYFDYRLLFFNSLS